MFGLQNAMLIDGTSRSKNGAETGNINMQAV